MTFNIQDLKKVNDDNQQNWPEGTQKVKDVNNAGRADEGMLARWFADYNGSKITTGTASALVVDLDTAPTAYYNGLTVVTRVHVNVAADATLNAGGLGAAPIKKNGGNDLKEGDLVSQTVGVFVSDGSSWTLTSVAIPNIGTEVGDLIVLEDVNGSAGLPAVDGSQLTGITSASYNYLGGLTTARDSATAITVRAGQAEDDGHAIVINLANNIQKTTAAFAEGNANGGLDTGTIASSTLYAVWLIQRSDTKAADVLFSTSFAAPTLPTNYDKKRLIWAFKTDGSSNIVNYTQVDDYCRFLTVDTEISDATATLTPKTGTLLVPPNSTAHIYARLGSSGTTNPGGSLYIRTAGASDPITESFAFIGVQFSGGGNYVNNSHEGAVLVNGSSTIEYAQSLSNGTNTVYISPIGFTMHSRGEPV